MSSGEIALLPVFATFASLREDAPPLVKMAAEAGGDPFEFAFDSILNPFLEHWLEGVAEHGYHPEPHAQNLLLAFDRQGGLSKQQFHRDFEAFYVEFDFRRRCGLPIPKRLPRFGRVRETYKQYRFGGRFEKVLETFIPGSILYNVHRSMTAWQQRGFLGGKRQSEEVLGDAFNARVARWLQDWSEMRVPTGSHSLHSWGWKAVLAGRRGRFAREHLSLCNR